MRGLPVVALLCAGCVFDPHRHYRPARFTVGASTHHFSSATPQPATARTSTPPAAPTLPHDATAMSAQFSLLFRNIYLGIEAEAGTLEAPGSNLAGGFAVIGGEASSHLGALAVEVATGWRSLRYRLAASDVVDPIIEPRVRAYLWLTSQLTFGVAAGASLGDIGWMAGAYLGLHSNLFDTFGPPE